MSLPYDRDITTISLSPSLASQAPKVRMTTDAAVFEALIVDIINGTNRTSLSVMPSSDRSVIKKCVLFVIKFNMASTGNISMIIIIELFIELRVFPIFDLQDRCLEY